jgi:uncharacterized membrane protein YgdD (TMEM256/DUF423 family)
MNEHTSSTTQSNKALSEVQAEAAGYKALSFQFIACAAALPAKQVLRSNVTSSHCSTATTSLQVGTSLSSGSLAVCHVKSHVLGLDPFLSQRYQDPLQGNQRMH